MDSADRESAAGSARSSDSSNLTSAEAASEIQQARPTGIEVTLDQALPWIKAIEQKDMCTAAHTWRVVLYVRRLCEEFGLEPEMIDRVSKAAALHDVGKLQIPSEILQKPGKLDDDEFEVIKTHSPLGHEMLAGLGINDQVTLNLVRHHHERWDGLGYPDKLVGEDIPIGARYFAVIDTFDAMTSVRPYRRELGAEAGQRAIDALEEGVGTRYWDQAVGAFVELFRKGELDWIMHYFNDDVPVPELGERMLESAVPPRPQTKRIRPR